MQDLHQHVTASQNHMATTFHFTLRCDQKRTVEATHSLKSAHSLVEALETELSEFLPESPVYKINSARPKNKTALTKSAARLFLKSTALSETTEGAFSPFAKSNGPLQEAFSFSVEAPDHVQVWKNFEGAHLSFGAIGKGFALDEVRTQLEQNGFEHYCLNAGGSSVVLSGFASPDSNWTWGWSWKKNALGENVGIPFQHHTGIKISLGISGRHEKGNHVLNPQSGTPVLEGKSSLVAHPSAASSDALSTALLVLGWQNGLKIFSHEPQRPALAYIEDSHTPYWNGLFQSYWGNIPC